MNVYVEHYKTTAFYKYEIGLLVGWHSLMKEKDKKALYMYEQTCVYIYEMKRLQRFEEHKTCEYI